MPITPKFVPNQQTSSDRQSTGTRSNLQKTPKNSKIVLPQVWYWVAYRYESRNFQISSPSPPHQSPQNHPIPQHLYKCRRLKLRLKIAPPKVNQMVESDKKLQNRLNCRQQPQFPQKLRNVQSELGCQRHQSLGRNPPKNKRQQ